jgi:DNA-binding NarL/FixJ family response regulator
MRVFLLDDHPLFRAGLNLLLQRTPDMEVLGEAGDVATMLEQIGENCPDIIVIDVHLACEPDGIESARLIRARCPHTKLAYLSSDSDFALVRRAIEAGAKAYLLKEDTPQDLVQALRTVYAGGVHFSPDVAAAMVEDYRQKLDEGAAGAKPSLSKREREVLKLLADGLRNKEIAERLGVGVKSVETYRARLMSKLQLGSTAELVRYAVREGLVRP